ncbi:hypothetical protein M0Q28_00870 [Patescibacteria group bacterium]|jgi:hypothetical protein|nr:hypothetical protein [Patescibacteria group bacterium]
MIWRLFLAGFLGLCAALYEVGAVSFLPPWFQLRPLLPFIVLLLVSSSRSRAFAAALGGAIVLDAYTLDHFSLALVRLPLMVVLLDVIASRFLTNRSVYATAALAVFARLFDWIMSWLFALAAVFLNIHDGMWIIPPAPGFVLLWDVVIISFLFFLVAGLTGRFQTRAGSSYASR